VKAIVQDRYGPPDVLALRDMDRPEPGDDEVLVRVRAAGLHVGDCLAMRGSPWPVRLMCGLSRPKYGVPGLDVAGEVEAVGGGVTRFRPGDEVFGSCRWPSAGACAELARAAEDHLVARPAGLSYEAAAALPTSALAALHGLRDAGRLEPGQRLLINGASGGVGTFAVQIGKALGAEVTGVCSAANAELVRSLGADRVVDYAREDFTQAGPVYEVILDNVENRPMSDVRRALTPRGALVLNSGTGATGVRMLVRLLWPVLLSPFTRHRLKRFFSAPNRADLEALRAMVEGGKLRPVVEATWPLAETPAALRHIETGRARGKVVVVV
jgi:NADPH:quinone reductase-like Zn-dependent oxidoreductase